MNGNTKMLDFLAGAAELMDAEDTRSIEFTVTIDGQVITYMLTLVSVD